jgi:hypothetical protein
VALAATPSHPAKEITACVPRSSNAVMHISSASGTCPTRYTEHSWNVTGPKDATGPSAASSSTTVVTAGAAGLDTVTALCLGAGLSISGDSQVAIGGGGSDTVAVPLTASLPSSTTPGTLEITRPVSNGVRGNGWTVTFAAATGAPSDGVVTAFAVCSS